VREEGGEGTWDSVIGIIVFSVGLDFVDNQLATQLGVQGTILVKVSR
jgi:hypothetical protein